MGLSIYELNTNAENSWLNNNLTLAKNIFLNQANQAVGLNKISNMGVDTFNDSTGASGLTYSGTNKNFNSTNTLKNYQASTNLLPENSTPAWTKYVSAQAGSYTIEMLNSRLHLRVYNVKSLSYSIAHTNQNIWEFESQFQKISTAQPYDQATFVYRVYDGTKVIPFSVNPYDNKMYCGSAAGISYSWDTSNHIIKIIRNAIDSVKFYLDGVLVSTQTYSSQTADTTAANIQLYIGAGTSCEMNVYVDYIKMTDVFLSNTLVASTVPSKMYITKDVTLNGDTVTYYGSRDDGTTWTQLTPDALTDISAQPSGTNMKVKAVPSGSNATINAWAFGWK